MPAHLSAEFINVNNTQNYLEFMRYQFYVALQRRFMALNWGALNENAIKTSPSFKISRYQQDQEQGCHIQFAENSVSFNLLTNSADSVQAFKATVESFIEAHNRFLNRDNHHRSLKFVLTVDNLAEVELILRALQGTACVIEEYKIREQGNEEQVRTIPQADLRQIMARLEQPEQRPAPPVPRVVEPAGRLNPLPIVQPGPAAMPAFAPIRAPAPMPASAPIRAPAAMPTSAPIRAPAPMQTPSQPAQIRRQRNIYPLISGEEAPTHTTPPGSRIQP